MAESSPTHYIYPLNPESGFLLTRERDGKTFPTSLEGFRASRDYTRLTEWGLATNFKNVRADDFIWVYFSLPVGAIHAVGKVKSSPHFHKGWRNENAIWIEWNKTLTEQLDKTPIPYAAYRQNVQAAIGKANLKTQRVLNRWMKGRYTKAQQKRDKTVAFVTREIEVRQGQPEFRLDLMRVYSSRCAISECAVENVLQAAHITPVKAGGSHAVTNGLLLRADLHNLFDSGLITIDRTSTIHVDESIEDKQYRAFDGRKLSAVAKHDRPEKDALEAHRRLHRRK